MLSCAIELEGLWGEATDIILSTVFIVCEVWSALGITQLYFVNLSFEIDLIFRNS